ncbi:MAG TPA: mevalonate kinase [Roseiflexaceae bacterium]|nr:mevalonate kinase [Roseiflexaceae bacterium]
MTEASAPGKLILCGEHAVVYGRPAIAVPLASVRARAVVEGAPPGTGVSFEAPDLGRSWSLAGAPDDPFSQLATTVLDRLAPGRALDLRVTLSSAIPLASGMGSGAAIATALVRALAAHLGVMLPPEEVSALVYTSERRFHGTPSGIDNTVVALERPVWFQRSNDQRPTTNDQREAPPTDTAEITGDQRSSFVVRRSSNPAQQAVIEPIAIGAPLTLLVGDTGVRSETRLPVGEVRRRREADPARYEALFNAVGAVAARAREALAAGDLAALGGLLDENHALLRAIGVSSPELDQLVSAARAAGALGAKLSGAGWGGVMLALVGRGTRERVRAALLAAGAVRVIETEVPAG